MCLVPPSVREALGLNPELSTKPFTWRQTKKKNKTFFAVATGGRVCVRSVIFCIPSEPMSQLPGHDVTLLDR